MGREGWLHMDSHREKTSNPWRPPKKKKDVQKKKAKGGKTATGGRSPCNWTRRGPIPAAKKRTWAQQTAQREGGGKQKRHLNWVQKVKGEKRRKTEKNSARAFGRRERGQTNTVEKATKELRGDTAKTTEA